MTSSGDIVMFWQLFQVIPVAIGAETDRNELEKITSNRKNIITSAKSEEPEVLGKKVMKSILKGMFNSNIPGNIFSFRNPVRFVRSPGSDPNSIMMFSDGCSFQVQVKSKANYNLTR